MFSLVLLEDQRGFGFVSVFILAGPSVWLVVALSKNRPDMTRRQAFFRFSSHSITGAW